MNASRRAKERGFQAPNVFLERQQDKYKYEHQHEERDEEDEVHPRKCGDGVYNH